MKIFNIFAKRKQEVPLILETMVEMNLISKEEMLFIRKERAIKEWEGEVKLNKRKGA